MDSLQNEPRFTPVTGNGHHAEIARKRFDPTRIFVEKDRLTWFWFGFAMLVLVGSAVDRIYLVQSFKQRERVIVVDPASTFYVSPLLKFSEAKDLHAQQSTLAAIAFLERNPKGFDNDDLLKQMFLKRSLGQGQRRPHRRRTGVQSQATPPKSRSQPGGRAQYPRGCRSDPSHRPACSQWDLSGPDLHRSHSVQVAAPPPAKPEHGAERKIPHGGK